MGENEKFDKLLGIAGLTLATAGAAYGAYSWVTYSGPYRWLAEWQIAHFGSYEVTLTTLGLIGVLSLTPLILTGIYFKDKAGSPWARIMTGNLAASSSSAVPQVKGLIFCFGLFIVGGVVAGVTFWLGVNKSRQTVVFEEINLTDHRLPKTNHVDLKGIAQTGMIIEFVEDSNGSKTTTTYLPLTSRDWQENQPITFFLRPHANAYLADNRTYMLNPETPPFEIRQKGVLFRNDLPGPFFVEYQKHGLMMALPYMVLDTDTQSDLDIYWVTAVVAGAISVVMLTTTIVIGLRNRRMSSA